MRLTRGGLTLWGLTWQTTYLKKQLTLSVSEVCLFLNLRFVLSVFFSLFFLKFSLHCVSVVGVFQYRFWAKLHWQKCIFQPIMEANTQKTITDYFSYFEEFYNKTKSGLKECHKCAIAINKFLHRLQHVKKWVCLRENCWKTSRENL